MKILIVSPHPDDETLGAGGLILKHKNQGDKLYWMNVTDVTEKWDGDFRRKREIQINKIQEYYNFDGVYNLKFEPCSLEIVDRRKIIDCFRNCIMEIQPDWIVLPNESDAHSDHRITYEVCMLCTKAFRCPSIKKIMCMEIVSETDYSVNGSSFSANYYVDISEYIEKKIEAAKIYDTELELPPFPRSIENIRALARVRGASAGCNYAEAFKIIKEIDK